MQLKKSKLKIIFFLKNLLWNRTKRLIKILTNLHTWTSWGSKKESVIWPMIWTDEDKNLWVFWRLKMTLVSILMTLPLKGQAVWMINGKVIRSCTVSLKWLNTWIFGDRGNNQLAEFSPFFFPVSWTKERWNSLYCVGNKHLYIWILNYGYSRFFLSLCKKAVTAFCWPTVTIAQN